MDCRVTRDADVALDGSTPREKSGLAQRHTPVCASFIGTVTLLKVARAKTYNISIPYLCGKAFHH